MTDHFRALVLHGTADSLFPLPHARALVDAISGARLVELDEVVRPLPSPHAWGHVVETLIEAQ